jgi:hypothetical protein
MSIALIFDSISYRGQVSRTGMTPITRRYPTIGYSIFCARARGIGQGKAQGIAYGRRATGDGRRATGDGRRATGDGRRATGDGRHKQ